MAKSYKPPGLHIYFHISELQHKHQILAIWRITHNCNTLALWVLQETLRLLRKFTFVSKMSMLVSYLLNIWLNLLFFVFKSYAIESHSAKLF